MRALLVTLLTVSLAGCPAPEEEAPAPGPPPAAEAAPVAEAPPAAPTDAPPPAPGTPVEPALTDGPVAPVKPPGLASLIQGGKSVSITGTLKGATTAHVDIAAAATSGEPHPDVLEVIDVTNGTFTVKAPATYARDLYITAVVSSGAPSPTDPGGMVGPITLAGKDVAVDITVSKDDAWRKKLPWYPPGGAPPPPVTTGGSPAGPPLDAAAAAAGVAPPAPMPAGTPGEPPKPPTP